MDLPGSNTLREVLSDIAPGLKKAQLLTAESGDEKNTAESQ